MHHFCEKKLPNNAMICIEHASGTANTVTAIHVLARCMALSTRLRDIRVIV